MFLSWGFEVSSPFYPGIARYPAFNRSRTTRAVRCLCHGSNKRGSFQLFNSWQYSLVHSSLDILWTAEHRSTHPDGTNGLMTRPADPSSPPFDCKILGSTLNAATSDCWTKSRGVARRTSKFFRIYFLILANIKTVNIDIWPVLKKSRAPPRPDF